MPGGTFYIKQGDRLPALLASLIDGNGNPVDLSSASAVTFSMVDGTGSAKITDAACTVVTATSGLVSYSWGASDTNTIGTFAGEFEVTTGGLVQRFPNDSNIIIVITAKLG